MTLSDKNRQLLQSNHSNIVKDLKNVETISKSLLEKRAISQESYEKIMVSVPKLSS